MSNISKRIDLLEKRLNMKDSMRVGAIIFHSSGLDDAKYFKDETETDAFHDWYVNLKLEEKKKEPGYNPACVPTVIINNEAVIGHLEKFRKHMQNSLEPKNGKIHPNSQKNSSTTSERCL